MHRHDGTKHFTVARVECVVSRFPGTSHDDTRRGSEPVASAWESHSGSLVAAVQSAPIQLIDDLLSSRVRIAEDFCLPQTQNVPSLSPQFQIPQAIARDIRTYLANPVGCVVASFQPCEPPGQVPAVPEITIAEHY